MFDAMDNLTIIAEKKSPSRIPKNSFPLRYGKYALIRTPEYEFQFNLNGEIKSIRGLGANWPHPAEQLKRTDANDWVYYSLGDESGEKGVSSWLGEYYLPCLPYPSNPIWEVDYHANPSVMGAFAAWPQLYGNLYGADRKKFHQKARDLIARILKHDDGVLHERSRELHAIIGGSVSVLPPDTRHADYEVIPLNISDGCLFHCEFCCVKSEHGYKPRSEVEIHEQIGRLKRFYGRNLENYNALFLGNHDALAAGEDLILASAAKAHRAFGFESREVTPFLFLFGSATALLSSKARFWEKLNRLPFFTYVNIGLESVHEPTLKMIGKPLDSTKVQESFKRMLDINCAHENIAVTANFVMGKDLKTDHYESLKALFQEAPAGSGGKGTIYLSPLKDSPKRRELLPLVRDMKDHSRLPVYVYLIQRL